MPDVKTTKMYFQYYLDAGQTTVYGHKAEMVDGVTVVDVPTSLVKNESKRLKPLMTKKLFDALQPEK